MIRPCAATSRRTPKVLRYQSRTDCRNASSAARVTLLAFCTIYAHRRAEPRRRWKEEEAAFAADLLCDRGPARPGQRVPLSPSRRSTGDIGSLIDSHALVGSCAQVGSGVHVSAAAQIGGVLEPVGALPVIVEDDALVGGNTGLYEGAVVKRRAVIGAGTVLTGSTPIYDLPRGRIIRPAAGEPTVVPEGAVVVPGARAVTSGAGPGWGLSLATPVIVKYRDDRTDTRTELEAWIR